MSRARSLKRLSDERDSAWEVQQMAQEELHSAKSKTAGYRRALVAYRRAVRDFQVARCRLAMGRAVMRLEERIPKLLVGVPLVYGYGDIKVCRARGNASSVYYGGQGTPDGLGHGHHVVTRSGRIDYLRRPGMTRGAHNHR